MSYFKLQKTLLKAITNEKEESFIDLCINNCIDYKTLYSLNLNKLSQSCVHLACIYNRRYILEYLWHISDHSEDIFLTKDSCYKEPIHHACQHGSLDCVRWLLENINKDKININVMKKADWTPLMLTLVSKNVSTEIVYNIIDLLIIHDADVRIKNKDGWTALHLACKHKTVNIIDRIAREAPECCLMRSVNGRSPLHTACLNGNIGVVGYLVEHFNGTCVNIVDDCGATPLMDSLVGGHYDVALWLLDEAGASIDCYDNLGRHTVHVVCESAPLKSLIFLLDRYPTLVNLRTLDRNSTPILSAAKMKRGDFVKVLRERGADITALDNGGRGLNDFLEIYDL